MAVLKRVGLADRMLHRPGELPAATSASTVAACDRTLLYVTDEPTGALDTKTVARSSICFELVKGILSALTLCGVAIQAKQVISYRWAHRQ